MRTPAFWYQPAGVLAWLLSPFGWVYGRVTAWRMRKTGVDSGLPVICVGNFTAGGAGKTPTTLWLAELLRAEGRNPFIVSRGYGGREAGPLRVDARMHTAAEVGDEPLMMAAHAPVIVAKGRAEGARLAREQGADCILLDDGLQSPALKKTVSIAVVDAGAGHGNGFCVPAGPLRAPLAWQMRHVQAVLSIGSGDHSSSLEVLAKAQGIPVLHGRLVLDRDAVAALAGKPLLAFAGIGRPAKFFESLREAGLDVRETASFPDHHPYSAEDATALLAQAEAAGHVPVTTEKDAVKLPSNVLTKIATIPVKLKVDATEIRAVLARHSVFERRRG